MDKKKQIEEMAKAMLEYGMEKYPTETSVFTEVKLREQFYPVFLTYAEHLYNAGYRKIPENEEKLEKQVRELDKELNLAKSVLSYDDERPLEKWAEHLRKETAEKFAERLKSMAYQSTDWSHGEHPMVVEVDYIDEICEEITEGKDV